MQNLFFYSVPIVFGINLIHFFDGRKDSAAEHLITFFKLVLRSFAAPFNGI